MSHFFFLHNNMDVSNPNESYMNEFITTADLPELTERAVTGDMFKTLVPLKPEDIPPFITTGDIPDIPSPEK